MPRGRLKTIKLCVLTFLHGALIVAMLVCVMMSRYENQLIDSIVSRTVTQDMSDQQKALALLNQTHELLKPRAALFSGSERVGIRERLFTSADVHLMDGNCLLYTSPSPRD